MILALETSTNAGSIAIADENGLIGESAFYIPNAHASVLHPVIKGLFEGLALDLKDVKAIVVGSGPGSYTGMRISAAAAKGFCAALNIPLIAVSGLQALAEEVHELLPEASLVCPMLDARRMEVYLGLYENGEKELIAPVPVVYAPAYFEALTQDRTIIFTGYGLPKLQAELQKLPNTRFVQLAYPKARFIASLGMKKFKAEKFEDLATFQPSYLKIFDQVIKKEG